MADKMDSQTSEPRSKVCNLGSTGQNIPLGSAPGKTQAGRDGDRPCEASDAANQAEYPSAWKRVAIMNALCLAVLCLALVSR